MKKSLLMALLMALAFTSSASGWRVRQFGLGPTAYNDTTGLSYVPIVCTDADGNTKPCNFSGGGGGSFSGIITEDSSTTSAHRNDTLDSMLAAFSTGVGVRDPLNGESFHNVTSYLNSIAAKIDVLGYMMQNTGGYGPVKITATAALPVSLLGGPYTFLIGPGSDMIGKVGLSFSGSDVTAANPLPVNDNQTQYTLSQVFAALTTTAARLDNNSAGGASYFKVADPLNGESFHDISSYLSGTNAYLSAHLWHLDSLDALTTTAASSDAKLGVIQASLTSTAKMTAGDPGHVSGAALVNIQSKLDTANTALASLSSTGTASNPEHVTGVALTNIQAKLDTANSALASLSSTGTASNPTNVTGTSLVNIQAKQDQILAQLSVLSGQLGNLTTTSNANSMPVRLTYTPVVTCPTCPGGSSSGGYQGVSLVSSSITLPVSIGGQTQTLTVVFPSTQNVALPGLTTTAGAIRVTNTDQQWDLGPGPATSNTQRVAIANSLTITVQERANTLFSYTNLTASLNGTIVTNTACVIDSLCVDNTAGNPNYLKIYDRTTIPTVATDLPALRIALPANNSMYCLPRPLRLNNGFVFLTTQNSAMTDGTSITAGTMNVAGNIRPITP